MPVYLGKDVSDAFLQGLIEAYREGYGEEADTSDTPIISTLEADEVVAEGHARTLGKLDACREGLAGGDDLEG